MAHDVSEIDTRGLVERRNFTHLIQYKLDKQKATLVSNASSFLFKQNDIEVYFYTFLVSFHVRNFENTTIDQLLLLRLFTSIYSSCQNPEIYST
jgi:hypothetical protein